eukprot:TRINITY_DN9804_c0_g2_i1.p1 TRINITY_DN9804_c0_g2~~TRINITY_DN9804_c0_g2_i1.p1  ORF type:complete len:100 (-),score=7.98 TRINITY_DN9804_c0_g2_i1:154-453(-)
MGLMFYKPLDLMEIFPSSSSPNSPIIGNVTGEPDKQVHMELCADNSHKNKTTLIRKHAYENLFYGSYVQSTLFSGPPGPPMIKLLTFSPHTLVPFPSHV